MITIDKQTRKDLLSRLVQAIRYSGAPIESYLKQEAKQEILHPVETPLQTAESLNELLPAEFFEGFGIRRIVFNENHGRVSLSDGEFMQTVRNRQLKFKWYQFQNQSIVNDLKVLFKNVRIIEFSDWANLNDAPDIWDNLRRDVIQPLHKKDFEFIFSPGDLTKKAVSDISEVLDVMSDFALYGRVSLLMEANDAVRLWARFNGFDTATNSIDLAPPGLRDVYQFLFNTLHIQHPLHAHQVLIYTTDGVSLVGEQQDFEFPARKGQHTTTFEKSRDYFVAGYSLGLLLHLETRLSIALGIALSGTNREDGIIPGVKSLISYLEAWKAELEQELLLKMKASPIGKVSTPSRTSTLN